MESLKAFGRASHYSLIARGHVVEVLRELNQLVCHQMAYDSS